jgi:NAD/NADP transhydrogenase alpha subunit
MQKRKNLMRIIYVLAGVAAIAIIAAAYWSGGRVGTEKCRAEVAELAATNGLAFQEEIIETKRIVNAEAYNTGARDIRNQLRKHYTIKN